MKTQRYKFTVHDFNNKRAWYFYPSESWLKAHPNYHAVSIGFVLGEDISQKSLDSFIKKGLARETDYERANHSGCLSYCVLRGDKECRW